MALPVWPAILPQNPFGNDDPVYTPMDNIIVTNMDGGPAKRRPMFTAVPETLKVKLYLRPAQRAALRTFIKVTLGYVSPFMWKDFRNQTGPNTFADAVYVYAGAGLPVEQYMGGDASGTYWIVEFQLEMQP